jgi:predicted metal-binding protein
MPSFSSLRNLSYFEAIKLHEHPWNLRSFEMKDTVKLGIIICGRYQTCSGGKCFRALHERKGAFDIYAGRNVEIVGFTTCGGCPGGNVEYAPEEMKKNGADVIHLATGFLVGYPPCPFLEHFLQLIPEKFGIGVVAGTHPIPQKYFTVHQKLGSWSQPHWKQILKPALSEEVTRIAYD